MRDYLVMYRIGATDYRYASIAARNGERAYQGVREHFKKNSLVFVYKTGVIWNKNIAAQADITIKVYGA